MIANEGNATKPQPVVTCKDAQELRLAFSEMVRELVKLHELQFDAIANRDDDPGRFDILIHDASERKQNAKYAYLAHMEVHGCGTKR